jgi:hypothetical protein
LTPVADDCDTSLCRILWVSGQGSDDLVEAFALKTTRESGRRSFGAALAPIAGKPVVELDLPRVDSDLHLVNSGIHDHAFAVPVRYVGSHHSQGKSTPARR